MLDTEDINSSPDKHMQKKLSPDGIQNGYLTSSKASKPFLKWAGGKGQLLAQIDDNLPPQLKEGRIKKYAEPFLGGGAVFFYIAQNYPVEEYYLSDINPELILAYKTIQKNADSLIARLKKLEKTYFALNPEKQKDHFYTMRDDFNAALSKVNYSEFSKVWIERTAQIIFLNRTCFNGLFRVNSRGEFNVPFGSYMNPKICDEENLSAISELLQRVELRIGNFETFDEEIDSTTFVYFDPPYRPISVSSSFTSYSKSNFNDESQMDLATYYRKLHEQGAKLLLSNSDPKNTDESDLFFDELYKGFKIERVLANRAINANGNGRKAITEILVMNY